MARLFVSHSKVNGDTVVEAHDPLARLTDSVEMTSGDSHKAMPAETTGPTAFISYSRTDMAFVNRLEDALKARGVDARVDRDDIEKGEEWWTRIQQLIAEADTVIFVLSPDSAVSSICQNEVDFAEGLKKRLIPIVARDLGVQPAPAALARLNWIFFCRQPSRGRVRRLRSGGRRTRARARDQHRVDSRTHPARGSRATVGRSRSAPRNGATW
jgi:hypothetical protein